MTLAESAAVAALARSVVTALSIDKGNVGPEEYYPSEEKYLEALLRSRLKQSRPG